MVRAESVSLPVAAGGAGVATSNVSVDIQPCRLVGVKAIFAGTENAGCVITITNGGRTVAKIPAGNTTRTQETVLFAVDSTGAQLPNTSTPFNPLVHGRVTATLTVANNGDAPTLVLFYAPE